MLACSPAAMSVTQEHCTAPINHWTSSNHNSLEKEFDNEAFFTMSINTAPKKATTITGHNAAVCYRKVALEGYPRIYEKIANYPANVIPRTYSWRATGFNKQLMTKTDDDKDWLHWTSQHCVNWELAWTLSIRTKTRSRKRCTMISYITLILKKDFTLWG